jgi:hypothetical protein
VPGTDNDRFVDIALFYPAVGDCLFNTNPDHITNAGIAPLGSAQHFDALNTTRAAVVGHLEHALHLNHVLYPLPFTIAKRFID